MINSYLNIILTLSCNHSLSDNQIYSLGKFMNISNKIIYEVICSRLNYKQMELNL